MFTRDVTLMAGHKDPRNCSQIKQFIQFQYLRNKIFISEYINVLLYPLHDLRTIFIICFIFIVY